MAWVVWFLMAFPAKWKKLGKKYTFTKPQVWPAPWLTPRFSEAVESCGQEQCFGGRKTWVQIGSCDLPSACRSLPLPDAQFPLPGGCVKSRCVKPEQSSWWHTEDPPCGHIYECASGSRAQVQAQKDVASFRCWGDGYIPSSQQNLGLNPDSAAFHRCDNRQVTNSL